MAVKKEYKQRTIPAGKKQENFNIDTALLEKVKDLAYAVNSPRAEIYNKAVEKFIELYEKKNGKIKPRPKGGGLGTI